jgi:hypothetical protein
MELLAGADHIDMVMIDAGGCIYDDDQWALAVLKAARQLAPDAGIDETEFWSVYDAQRQAQGGSLSRTVATRFLPSGDPDELNRLARSHFQVPAASMYPDARPTLAALASKYKLGVVANPSEQHIAALKRDGLMQYFDVVVHPEPSSPRQPVRACGNAPWRRPGCKPTERCTSATASTTTSDPRSRPGCTRSGSCAARPRPRPPSSNSPSRTRS